jgi:sarcosine oxidase subunit alpha
MAALSAARGGARVIVCEREPVVGGELEFEAALIDGLARQDWIARTLTELDALGAVVLTSTAIVSTADGIAIAHGQPHGMPGADTLYRLYAPIFINAMGAVERSIAFVDNDRPGVMLSGAADRLWGRHGVLPGRTIVLFGNNDRIYATATRLLSAGATIAAVVDTRRSA